MDIALEEWRATLGPTLDGTFFCVQVCVPHLRALGRGSIVKWGWVRPFWQAATGSFSGGQGWTRAA